MTKVARNTVISLFVILWAVVFHYESLRHFYLEPLFQCSLPKVKLLFPPAGWIMFYNVDDTFACAEVYGVRQGKLQRLDPHDILRTRDIGYDNVHRNVLSVALERGVRKSFCAFLERKFPGFDDFVMTQAYYPSLTRTPHLRQEDMVYTCREQDGLAVEAGAGQ